MSLLAAALVSHAADAVEAPEEVTEAVVAVERVVVRHEGRVVLLRCINDRLRQHLVAKKSLKELLVVCPGCHQGVSKVWTLAHVEAIGHAVGLQQVLLNDCVDVRKARCGQGHSSSNLQVIRIVGVNRARLPNELHVLINGARALSDVAACGVALHGAWGADLGRQPLLKAQVCRHTRRLVVCPPLPRSPGVHLLAWMTVPEATSKAQEHAEGHQ
mmetsp:Transcript_144932/g.464477  ORF Transcript_144932/g.464477 Transcript_144932/m.464477 type:complete len:215 (-) Transcript_144932:555-1199(-)